MDNGKISVCESTGCGFSCCDFNRRPGAYIVLFPEESDTEQSMDHLEIIDEDYHGGKKAVCHAKHPENCDGGLKPVDCKVYPVFIKGKDEVIHGTHCPMPEIHKRAHIPKAQEHMDEYQADHPNIDLKSFTKKIEMHGYERLPEND